MRTRLLLLLLAALLCGLSPAYAASGRKVALRQDPLQRGLLFHRTYVSGVDNGANLLGTGSNTFTRASSATWLDGTGTLQTAGSGTARFDFAQTGNTRPGVLINQQATNLLPWSQDATNAVWNKVDCSITSAAITAPDGTLTGQKMVEDAVITYHYLIQATTLTPSSTYTYSIYLKQGERSWSFIQAKNLAGQFFLFFVNLSTGALGGSGGGLSNVTVTAVGNGWYRCSFSYPASTGAASTFVGVYTSTGDGILSYAGDGTSGIYVWGAQLETGSVATSYIPTTSATVTRAADVLTYPAAGNISATAGTLSMWVMTPFAGATNPQNTLFDSRDGGGQNGLLGYMQSGSVWLEVHGSAGTVVVSKAVDASSWAANAWHNVVLTWNNGPGVTQNDIGGWLDGAQMTTYGSNAYAVSNMFSAPIYLGSRMQGDYQVAGDIRDVSIWDRWLSSSEISTAYSQGY